MKRENIVVIQDATTEFAKLTGKIVAHVKAVGPLNCSDLEKVEQVWNYYYGKIPNEVYDTLKSFGEIFCFFETANQANTELSSWFPTLQLIDEIEYDEIDRDYYISVETTDSQGLFYFGT